MRSKIIKLMVCVLLVGTVVATGGFSLSLAQERITFAITPTHIDFDLKETSRFEQAYPDIKVNVVTISYGELFDKLSVSFSVDEPIADVFLMDCCWLGGFAEPGWVEVVDDRITPKMREGLMDSAKAGVIYKGHWYGLPYASEWQHWIYNERMLKEAGLANPPSTWEEFIEQSLKLKEANIVKYAWSGWWEQTDGLTCEYLHVLTTMEGGSTLFDAEGNPLFQESAGVEALQLMVDMIHKYKIVSPAALTYGITEADNLLLGGKAAFRIVWMGVPFLVLNNPEKSKVIGECKIGLTPSYDGKHPGTVAGPMALSMYSGSKHKEAAWKYLTFRCDYEGALRAALEAGQCPGWAKIYENPEFQEKVPGLDMMFETLKGAVPQPAFPWWKEADYKLITEFHNALTQKKSPRQALEDAAEKAREVRKTWEGGK